MNISQGSRVFLEISFRQDKYNCFGWVLVEVKTHSVFYSYYNDSEHFNDCIFRSAGSRGYQKSTEWVRVLVKVKLSQFFLFLSRMKYFS